MLYTICFSPTGGTEKVTHILRDHINETLQEETGSVDLLVRDPANRQASLNPDDIALIAVPSYGGRVPAIAASRLRMIRGNGAKAVIAAVYGNRAYEDTLLELRDIAGRSGFEVIAAVSAVAEHSIVREIAHGRPDDEDRRELGEIADKIIQKIHRQDNHCPAVPGTHPYKLFHGIPLGTYAKEHCILCASCALECPVGAIPEESPSEPSSGSCISCMRCVSICPAQARTASEDTVEVIRHKITPACAGRKSCEVFL